MKKPTTIKRTTRTGRALAVGVGVVLAGGLGAGAASASPDVTTTTTHDTVRLSDAEHGLLYFVNKSRADLCTPERLVFEAAFEEWLNNGAVGDPPPEPTSSREGVTELHVTTRLVDGRTLLTTVGNDVPVEAWRFDGEEGGIDCTATDGPKAELFASGSMDFSNSRHLSEPLVTGSVKLSGIVTDPTGGRWNASVQYLIKLIHGEFDVKGQSRLVPLG